MATLSDFFELQKLSSGDPLATNDYAFTHENINIIDRVLQKHEAELFIGTSPIDDPTEPLSLEIETEGGTIPAGRTVRYKFTWVDVNGAQTAASPEATITTPAPLARPAAPALELLSSGGVLLGGNYFYGLSAYIGLNTAETTMGTVAHHLVPSGSTNRNVLTLPTLPAGADGFNVYRRGPGETTYYFLDTIDMQVATPPTEYVDAGAVTPSYARSPTPTNLTYSTNKIVITVPGATPTVPDGYTWKVYRTFINGQYDSSLLEWVRTETVQDSGIISPETEDVGRGTTIGVPPTSSKITANTSRIEVMEDELDGIYSSFYKVTEDIDTDVEDPEETDVVLTIPAESFLKFEAYVIVDALAAQDMNILFNPSAGSVSMSFVDNIATTVHTEDVEYLIPGASPTLVGINLHGTIDALDEEDESTITLYIGQANTPATPGASTLKRGSWFRAVL